MKWNIERTCASALALFYGAWSVPAAQAYSFDMIVPDVRQPAAISGGSACPVRTHQLTAAGSIAVRWSTALNASPVTILTQSQTASGRLTEIEQAIAQALAAWAGVIGTTLVPATLTPLTRTATQNACGPDGLNSICFDHADMAFTPGVLAFTRVITTDPLGVHVGSSAVSTQLGQILDADIYFNPSDSNTAYATPQALAANQKTYDIESFLTHEFGHFLGFSHSAVWGAIMFPFAPAPGTFSGTRPAALQSDASLGDDDRTGLRVLYSDPADAVHRGSIGGKIFPANPLALSGSPPGVTGGFCAQVVAVEATSRAAVGATLGGWGCTAPGAGPVERSHMIPRLAMGD